MDVKKFNLKCPPTAIYYPEFITPQEEEFLSKKVYGSPKTRWTQLLNRRLQNWGGVPHYNGMIPEPIPDWLQACADKIASLGVFGAQKPNHVLVNEYTPGQGIMPHLDGPVFHPVISTISLGSHTVIDFFEEQAFKFSMWVGRRSLLVLQDDMYHKYMHGISESLSDEVTSTVVNYSECGFDIGQECERGTRISLTIRYVPKTAKMKLQFGHA